MTDIINELGHIINFDPRCAMDCLAQGVRIINTNHIVCFTNKAFERLSGVSSEQAEGKKCWEVFPNNLCHSSQCRLKRIINGEEIIQAEIEDHLKNGEVVQYIVSASPLYDSDKKLTGIMESFIDISETKNLKRHATEIENRYKAIVELTGEVGEGIFVIQDVNKQEGQIVFASRQCTNITGYTNGELFGKSFFDLFTPEHRDDSTRRHRRKMDGESLPGLYESYIIRKGGKIIPVELTSARTIFDDSPANVIYLRDISHRKEMERTIIIERNMAKNYLDAANSLIIAVDGEHKVTLINHKGCKILGYPREKIIGLKYCDSFLPIQFRNTITELFNDLFAGKIEQNEYFENPVLTSTGEERIIAWHNNILTDDSGNVTSVLCSGNDITDLRKTEKELYKYQHRLEDLIKIRTIQLEEQIKQRTKAENELRKTLEKENQLRQNLEKQMKQNAEFMRMIAHEMKTPLTSLLASSDLLVENYQSESASKLVKQVNKGVLDLEKRVTDLFDLAKGEVGMLALRYQDIYPTKILSGTHRYFKAEAERQGIEFITDWPKTLPIVCGDHQRITQVLNNLLNNAFKHTPPGGKITLKAKKIGYNLQIEVEDTGCGIPPDRIEEIFEPYYRNELSARSGSGMGLGLALSKLYIELHGGKIWAESKEGQGSKLFFTLPIEKRVGFYEVSNC
jgi:PAS domain S-box-containing protein